MNYAIEIEHLTKTYGRHRAVDNLSLRIPEGKIYGFLGRNGAGKTTTIRMIMGLIRPEKGKIRVLGRDVCRERLWVSGRIGAIVETPGFYTNLTAQDNLRITADLFKADKGRIGEMLGIVGLSEVGSKKVKEFSLGMKQRLGIANALVHSPKILILDEPANGLDPAGIKDMRLLLRSLSETHGITVLVSSHILSEIQLMADYVGIIDKGALIEETDIRSLMTEGQSYVLLEVEQVQAAVKVLRDMRLEHTLENGWQIKVFCSREWNSRLNRNLVAENIDVYNFSAVSMNLEERFLAITGEKSAS